MKGEAILQVENISKSYNDDPPVFKDVSFALYEKEKLALIGANGTGKSTLLRSSLKLLPANVESIRLFGKEISNCSRGELRKIRANVGFVFQKHNLVPRLSVLSNVIHGALATSRSPQYWYQSISPKSAREKAMFHLNQVGLSHVAMRRASDLSGGQSQRVAIARALMQDPKLLVADEPVASLDPKAGKEVMDLFHKLCKEKGLSFIFVSHHLEHAFEYSDRIIALKNNTIEFNEKTEKLEEALVRKIYE